MLEGKIGECPFFRVQSGKMIVWCMNVKELPAWQESDDCQGSFVPFFASSFKSQSITIYVIVIYCQTLLKKAREKNLTKFGKYEFQKKTY